MLAPCLFDIAYGRMIMQTAKNTRNDNPVVRSANRSSCILRLNVNIFGCKCVQSYVLHLRAYHALCDQNPLHNDHGQGSMC